MCLCTLELACNAGLNSGTIFTKLHSGVIKRMRAFRKTILRSGSAFLLLTMAVTGPLLVELSPASAASSEQKQKGNKQMNDPIVLMETSKGTIKIEIFKNDAPITSNNFLDLVQKGFYNGLSFHRYEPGFCLQGGDPRGNGTGGYVDAATGSERTIPLEIAPNHKHSEAGMLAMARSSDPNSASSQFYFTLGPASHLDGQYAIFGKVMDGLNVVKELRKGDKMTKVSVLEPVKK
jgi:peptidyl-prolyl cis-trans isomerase B (cyclophilin B)